MKKTVLIFFLFFIFFTLIFAKTQTDNALLFDYEDGQHQWYWPSAEGIKADVTIETQNVKLGKNACKMAWDFTNATEGFVCFGLECPTSGIIESLSFWIYANESLKGTSYNIWTKDVNGELYFANFTIKESGWQHISCKVSKSIPWKAGDENEIQDPPMSTASFTVGYDKNHLKDYIIIDDVVAEVNNIIPEETEETENIIIDESDLENCEVWIKAEDFETLQGVGSYTEGNKNHQSWANLDTENVHSGKKSANLRWKFDSERGGYSVYPINYKSPGKIKEIEFWAYADENAKGTKLSAWIPDEKDEMYCSATVIDKVGWNKYNMKVSDISPWKSGDGNNIKDGNMTFRAFLVEAVSPALAGNILIDDVSCLVEAPYTHFIIPSMTAEKDDYTKFWEKNGNFIIQTENISEKSVKDMSYELIIKDMNTEKIVSSKKIKAFTIKSGEKISKKVFVELPFGYYETDLKQYIGKRLISVQKYPLTFLNGKCNFNLGPAMNTYLTKAGYFGGVCTGPEMEFLNNIGCKWNRYTGRGRGGDWIGIEYEKDKYNVSGFLKDVKAHEEGNLDFVLLMCTYDQPKWRNYIYPDFATGYGRLMESIGKENVIDQYELGNEDNGSHTKTYTEVGRNGAAGIRKYDSSSLISPAATGGIDLYYFNEQKEKGLLDRMDLLIVHPYTGNNNPEDFKLVENSESMQDIIDEVGGFKSLWSTEFGYNDGTEGPSVLPDKVRGRFYTRSSMLQILAGYDRVGPFTWFNYWGLFMNYNGTLRGVAYQTMCKQLEGYRYAGALSAGPKLWVLIFEKFGKNPIAVCWTNEGEATYNFGSAVTYTDCYNNKIYNFKDFSEDLTYVHKLSDTTLVNAWENSINKELTKVKNYSGVSLSAETDIDTMWTELCNFGNQMKSYAPCVISVDRPNEAKISASAFRLLKAMLLKCRYDKCPKELENYNIGDFEKECKDFLENARLSDKTYAKTRYMINLFVNVDLERRAAIETNNSDFGEKLLNCEKIIAFFTREYLMNDSDARQDQVWAYIYNLKGEELNEKITLVPDVPIRVKVRVNNYSLNEQTANITLKLPEGWTYEPMVQTVQLTPGKDENTYFDIMAQPTENSKDVYIITETALGDNPIKGYAKFTDVELLSEISLTQIPSHGVHPESPMEFLVTNSGNETKSGNIKLYSQNKLVGSGTFENIAPKESKIALVDFTDTPLDLNNMKAVVSGDNVKTSSLEFKTEYCYAPYASDLDINQPSEIMTKYPLFIDREEYDWGSFLGSWSPNDCSANCYFAWDDNYLYFRGLVTDNVFCQISQDGHDMYEWDSMQINIVNPKNEIIQFGIAHVGDEDMVYMYRPRTEKMKDIPCKVKIGSNTHDYIMAIPWKYITETQPKQGDEFKVEVLINDHDLIAQRRCLERFSSCIFKPDDNTSLYGYIKLGK